MARVLLPALCVLAAGCGGGHTTTPPHRPTPTVTRHADTPTRAPAATPTVATATPGPSTEQLATLAAGKVLVQAQCAACHALADAGISALPTPVARSLDGIGALHDRRWLDAALSNACAHARPLRPGYNCAQMHAFARVLTAQQRAQVLAYLLSLR